MDKLSELAARLRREVERQNIRVVRDVACSDQHARLIGGGYLDFLALARATLSGSSSVKS